MWIPLRELPAADVATLDVHQTVDVCNLDGKEACGAYPVEAIACTGKDTAATTCSAGVQITPDLRRRLLTALDKPSTTSTVHVLIHHAASGTPRPEPAKCPPGAASSARTT